MLSQLRKAFFFVINYINFYDIDGLNDTKIRFKDK